MSVCQQALLISISISFLPVSSPSLLLPYSLSPSLNHFPFLAFSISNSHFRATARTLFAFTAGCRPLSQSILLSFHCAYSAPIFSFFLEFFSGYFRIFFSTLGIVLLHLAITPEKDWRFYRSNAFKLAILGRWWW